MTKIFDVAWRLAAGAAVVALVIASFLWTPV